jgi:hypothetical protein
MKRGPNWKREVYVPIVDPITRKFISAAVYEANKLEAAVKNAENREEKAHSGNSPNRSRSRSPVRDSQTGRFSNQRECDAVDLLIRKTEQDTCYLNKKNAKRAQS